MCARRGESSLDIYDKPIVYQVITEVVKFNMPLLLLCSYVNNIDGVDMISMGEEWKNTELSISHLDRRRDRNNISNDKSGILA